MVELGIDDSIALIFHVARSCVHYVPVVFAKRFNEPSAATKVGNQLTVPLSTNFLNGAFSAHIQILLNGTVFRSVSGSRRFGRSHSLHLHAQTVQEDSSCTA